MIFDDDGNGAKVPRDNNTSGLNGSAHNSSDRDVESYDVVIVGGGIAGIGAGIGAKQASPSSRVLIVESEGCLGGAATHRGVLSFAGLYSVESEPRRAVGAIWTELHRRLVEERAAAEVPDRIVAYVQVRLPHAVLIIETTCAQL